MLSKNPPSLAILSLRKRSQPIKLSDLTRFRQLGHLSSAHGTAKPPRLLKLFMVLVLLVAAPSTNLLAAPPGFATNARCDDIKFVFARGSGEALNGPSMSAWRDEIIAAIDHSAASLSYSFYELGSQPQDGYQYPAVSVSDNLDGYLNLIGAYISGGAAFRFGASVEEGMRELIAYTESISSACPATKFVLGGYSQGAMVLSGSLSSLNTEKIAYVSTFGDPKLYLPEGKPTRAGRFLGLPDACRGRNLSPYRLDVSDCRAYEGVLGSYRPYQPSAYAEKLGTWCHDKDIMCSSGSSLSDHASYVSSNLYRDAARVIVQKLTRVLPDQSDALGVIKKAKHNVAFVIDTTGSMSGAIGSYRAEAKQLAAKVKLDGGDVALFEYGDLLETSPRQLCGFSCSLSEFSAKIDTLATHGGGDTFESALSALLYALNHLDWQTGATKSIVLLTDALYHDPDRDGTTFAEVVQRTLEIDPVNVYAIAPEAFGTNHGYHKLTDATGGQVFTLGLGDLSSATQAIFERPVARLALSTYSGQVGDEFVFDASASYASDGSALGFDWDLDGDGEFELMRSSSVVRHTYDRASDHFVQVRVTDSSGNSSTMSARVTVSSAPLTLTTITRLSASPEASGAVTVSFQTDGAKALLATGDLVQGFIEVKNGTGSFTLQDIPKDLTITLTPYSVAGDRGVPSSLAISPDATTNAISPSGITDDPATPSLDLVAAPKAPNTGFISHKEYR